MRPLLLACSVALAAIGAPEPAAPVLALRKGDHVAILGSGAAEREQHAGWLETLVHLAHPGHELVVRNLAFAGDEVGVHRRSAGVPPLSYFLNLKPGTVTMRQGDDDITYLAGADFHASVLIAQWGFNESFAGPAGADAFRRRLDAWVVAQLAADYGQGRPRLVLVTPHAAQPVAGQPDLNANLALYAEQVRSVARARGLPCVDLFAISRELLPRLGTTATVHGIHLTEGAERALAPAVFQSLFGRAAPSASPAQVTATRAAVLEKNRQWFARYRTLDQFNIYGDRSRIAYADAKDPANKVTNAETMGQEMAQRDVITARCDRALWALAQGRPVSPDLSNLPKVDPVPANVPARAYLSGEDTIPFLKVPEGCRIELVADETTVPGLVNPVQLGFDAAGRLWVAVWPTYPSPRPGEKKGDSLLVLDLDPATGKPRRATTFLDGLSCPTGFQFYKGGVLLMQAPYLWHVRDTDGDGRGDAIERVLQGMDSADTHHTSNSLCREPGGAVYLSDGVFHRTQVETGWGPVRNTDGCIYRFEPNTGKFIRHAPYPFANPHGRVFDRWGNDLITDGTMNANYFGPAMSGHLDEGRHPGGMEEFWDRPSRPSPGTALLSSRHFPDDWQGDFLNCNVIGYQGIFRAKVSEQGSGVRAVTRPDGLVQADLAKAPNFRPVGAAVAPDGSIYVIDWSQQLIGHLQHHLRDPNRDHAHGRIYRITYPSRPLLKPKPIAGQPIEILLDLLKEPEDGTRLRAKLELETRPAEQVLAALDRWVRALDRAHPDFEHHRLEALWVRQWFDAVSPAFLTEVLRSPEPRARAQAVRVLGYWRDRVPGALDLLESVALDPHPRVRLEVVRVCSFFRDGDAARALRIALLNREDKDYYIGYCLAQTRAQLLRFPGAKAADAGLPDCPLLPEDQPPSNLRGEEDELWRLGREVYLREGSCVTCHQKDGRGLKPAFPPLAGSEWVGRPDGRVIKIVLDGLNGPITVRGVEYGPDKGSPPMPGYRSLLKDREVAAVITYVRNAFGNRGPAMSPETVARVRAGTQKRNGFWTAEELQRDHPSR